MEKIVDSLVFDFRMPEDLFDNNQLGKLLYADVIKRWASGDNLSDNEQFTLTKILIYLPDYVCENNKEQEFIQCIRQTLQQPEIQNNKNPEKGLYLYMLVYLLLKSGKVDQVQEELNKLKELISDYNTNKVEIFSRDDIEHILINIDSVDSNTESTDKVKLAQAYFKIISDILDLDEILDLYPVYTVHSFPTPNFNLNEVSFYRIRDKALDMLMKKSYKTAFKLYKVLRLTKFCLPSTLIHFARVELVIGNLQRAEVYTSMVWHIREIAPRYVVNRVLFMIIFLNSLQSKPADIWLACIKQELIQIRSFGSWDMQEVLDLYKDSLKSDDYQLLTNLLINISLDGDPVDLNYSIVWKNVKELPREEWPEYKI